MERKNLLSCLQESATEPHHEPAESTPYSHTILL